MSNTFALRNVAAHYHLPFFILAQGLEKYIQGRKLDIQPTTIPAVSKLFVEAYEWCRIHGRLPALPEEYGEIGASRRQGVSAMVKLEQLYEKATGKQLKEEREIGITAVKFLGLLENLAVEGAKETKAEREKYQVLLRFSNALIQEAECEGKSLGNEDDE